MWTNKNNWLQFFLTVALSTKLKQETLVVNNVNDGLKITKSDFSSVSSLFS